MEDEYIESFISKECLRPDQFKANNRTYIVDIIMIFDNADNLVNAYLN